MFFTEKRGKDGENLLDHLNSKTPISEIWSLIRPFKRCNLALPNQTVDPSKEKQFIQEAIQRLCPPFCFQDNSTSLEER